jgi:hypothetical protein
MGDVCLKNQPVQQLVNDFLQFVHAGEISHQTVDAVIGDVEPIETS